MSEPWLKLITKVGVWAALAIWMVYRLDNNFSSELKLTKQASEETRAVMQQHVTAMLPVSSGMEMLVNLQLQQCVNAADDYLKRGRCFDAIWARPTRNEK